jgi:signal transduction histidine kinase
MRWPWQRGPQPDSPGSRRTEAFGVDAALAAIVFVAFAMIAGPGSGDVVTRNGGVAWVVVLQLLAVAPIALRRIAPVDSVLLVCGALMLGVWHPAGLGAAAVSALVVDYTRAALGALRQAVATMLALAVCAVGVGVGNSEPAGIRAASITAGVLALLACFFLGRTVYTRRAYTAALEERARTAELNREAAARQAVLDERRRIARELHDMVAHHVSVMGVLATGARRALRRDPDTADEALRTIEETGRTSLREMRRMLDVLRSDDERAEDEPPPEPGVTGLEHLVEQVREAGLTVGLLIGGPARPLEPGADLTVFRIVQEALTNVLKHAGAASATVALEFLPDAVRVTVTDDGHGPTLDGHTSAGHGLVGMRERVALYAGTLQTGPRAGGGYRVMALLPLEPERGHAMNPFSPSAIPEVKRPRQPPAKKNP